MVRKEAKMIAKKISGFMQDNKFTMEDLRRGLVVLGNLEHEYVWKGKESTIYKKKFNKDVGEEVCST